MDSDIISECSTVIDSSNLLDYENEAAHPFHRNGSPKQHKTNLVLDLLLI